MFDFSPSAQVSTCQSLNKKSHVRVYLSALQVSTCQRVNMPTCWQNNHTIVCIRLLSKCLSVHMSTCWQKNHTVVCILLSMFSGLHVSTCEERRFTTTHSPKSSVRFWRRQRSCNRLQDYTVSCPRMFRNDYQQGSRPVFWWKTGTWFIRRLLCTWSALRRRFKSNRSEKFDRLYDRQTTGPVMQSTEKYCQILLRSK